MFPVILIGLVAFIRSLIKNTDYPTEMHIQNSSYYSKDNISCDNGIWLKMNVTYSNIFPDRFDLQRFANKYAIVGKNKNLNKMLSAYLNQTVIQYFGAVYKLQVGYKEYETEQDLFDYISGNEYQKNNNRDDSLIFAVQVPENALVNKNFNFTIK